MCPPSTGHRSSTVNQEVTRRRRTGPPPPVGSTNSSTPAGLRTGAAGMPAAPRTPAAPNRPRSLTWPSTSPASHRGRRPVTVGRGRYPRRRPERRQPVPRGTRDMRPRSQPLGMPLTQPDDTSRRHSARRRGRPGTDTDTMLTGDTLSTITVSRQDRPYRRPDRGTPCPAWPPADRMSVLWHLGASRQTPANSDHRVQTRHGSVRQTSLMHLPPSPAHRPVPASIVQEITVALTARPIRTRRPTRGGK